MKRVVIFAALLLTAGIVFAAAPTGTGSMTWQYPHLQSGYLIISNNYIVGGTLTNVTIDGAVTVAGATLTSATLTNSTLQGAASVNVNGTVDAAGIVACASNLTVAVNATIVGECSVDSKYTMVGPDASTALMAQTAAITSTSSATQTNTFGVAFGAAPRVVCTYTEDPGDVRPIWVSSVDTTQFICNITADKNYDYVAVGQRP